MSTTYMNLDLPTVSTTLGPEWASLLNAALESLDAHDHSSGKGTKVTPAGLNINADLTFAGYRSINLKSSKYTEQNATLTGATNAGSIYNYGGNLYWTNGSGTAVQITSGGAVVSVPTDANAFEYTSGTSITISPSDTFVVLGIDSSAARTVTLPLASAVDPGRLYCIVDETGDADTNSVSIECQGSDTIMGDSTYEHNSSYGAIFVVSNGVDKYLVI